MIFLSVGSLFFFFRQEKDSLTPFLETEERQNEKPVHFAVMADVHSDWANLGKALSKAREQGVALVIIAGDLTDLGKEEELVKAKAILDQAGLTYYLVPGNHDLWFGEKIKADLFSKVFGLRYQSFKNGKTKFILVDNGSSRFGSSEEQWQWLVGEIKECRIFYCLVFTHMPLNHGTSKHIMGEDNPKAASQAAKLVKLLVENEVRKLFVGHLHYQSSYQIDGLSTTIVGAVTDQRNYQTPRFMSVVKQGDLLTEETVLLAN